MFSLADSNFYYLSFFMNTGPVLYKSGGEMSWNRYLDNIYTSTSSLLRMTFKLNTIIDL